MKLIRIKQDKGNYYQMIIEFNGIPFESVYIKPIPQIAKIFSISESEVKKLIK